MFGPLGGGLVPAIEYGQNRYDRPPVAINALQHFICSAPEGGVGEVHRAGAELPRWIAPYDVRAAVFAQ